MNNKQVAHLWANKSRSEARGSHFYFTGDTIYSYGSHFPIARHYKGVVLMTTRGYSSSTARHIRYVRSASHHLTTFHVIDPSENPTRRDVQVYADRIKQMALTVARKRDKAFMMGQLEELVNEANQFCEHFKFKTRFEMPSDFEALKAEVKKENERRRKAEARKQKQIERENQDRINRWLSGEIASIPYNITKVYLRAELYQEIGNEYMRMVTSKGASVPLDEAQRAFRFCLAMRERGWHRNGEKFKVGDYQLDAINKDGVVAGCHRIGWDEIERFGKQMGWV
jgi:hypothetical protein